MQCGAKMNMVTFSAFEKQVCNFLYFLHKFRNHTGSSTPAGRGKDTPDTPSKTSAESHREDPQQPYVSRKNALKTPWSLPHREAPQVSRISFSVPA